jgi:hypothetical protein
MSLVAIAMDSVQAVAVSDGRMFTAFHGEKKLLRNDASKILQLSPSLCVAATGQGCFLLEGAVWEWFAERPPDGESTDPFDDTLNFAWDWLRASPVQYEMRVCAFGWSNARKRMRCATGCRQAGEWQFSEIFPLAQGKPIYAALGKADESVQVSPDSLITDDPLPVLLAALSLKESQDTDVGGKRFEYLLQAPSPFLHRSDARPDPWKVWRIFDPAPFAAALGSNPPAGLDEIASHLAARALLTAARLGVPLESLCQPA